MFRHFLIGSLIVLVSAMCISQSLAAEEGTSFDGRWRAVAVVADGELQHDSKGTLWTFEGKWLLVSKDGQSESERAIIAIDESKSPVLFDAEFVTDSGIVHDVRKGVLSLKRNTMIVSLTDDDVQPSLDDGNPQGVKRISVDGKERRATFAPKDNILIILERVQ